MSRWRFRLRCSAEHCVKKRERAPIRVLVCAVEHFFAACLIRSLGRFLSNQAAYRAKFVVQAKPIASEIRKHNGGLIAIIGWTISILELLTIREFRPIAATLPFSWLGVSGFPWGQARNELPAWEEQSRNFAEFLTKRGLSAAPRGVHPAKTTSLWEGVCKGIVLAEAHSKGLGRASFQRVIRLKIDTASL